MVLGLEYLLPQASPWVCGEICCDMLWCVCVCVCVAPSRIVNKVFFFFFFFPLHSKHLFSVSWDLMIHLRSWHTHKLSWIGLTQGWACTQTHMHRHTFTLRDEQDHTGPYWHPHQHGHSKTHILLCQSLDSHWTQTAETQERGGDQSEDLFTTGINRLY